MPTYDYGCPRCGTFSLHRPMSEYDRAQDCPGCGMASPRLMLCMPGVAGMDPGRRAAMATNERSANAPRQSSAHRPGCGCCAGAGARNAAADEVKGFPSRRPWMISH
jgi:putative FmdB family regulatory protein